MTNLISVEEMKNFDLSPNNDGTYNKEDIEELLNKKAIHYQNALKELEKTYQSINDLDAKHQAELKEAKKSAEEYEANSRLLTKLTIEAQSNLDKSKEKAESTLNDASEQSTQIINIAKEKAQSIIDDARQNVEKIKLSTEEQAKDYLRAEKEKVDQEVKIIKEKAIKEKEEQEKEINDLRNQTLENNKKIIEEGSAKAKSLVIQARDKASRVLEDAQTQCEDVSKDINEIRKAGASFAKNIETLIQQVNELQNLKAYQTLKEVTSVTKADHKVEQSQSSKELTQQTSDHVKEVANQNANSFDIHSIDISNFPEELQNSIKLQQKLTNENK